MPAEPKTRPTDASVDDFLMAVPNAQRRADGFALRDLLAELTGERAVMWGPSIVGFGGYQGPTGVWPAIGFSPRKAELVVYVMHNGVEPPAEIMARLGKHTTGAACLYLKKLSDVDLGALRDLCAWSLRLTRERWPVAVV